MSKSNMTIGLCVITALLLVPAVCPAQFDLQGLIQRKVEQRAAARAQGAMQQQPSTPAKRRALIITVEDYSESSGLAKLDGITKDGQAIKKVLMAGGFEEKNVRLLQTGTDAVPADRPTRDNIKAAVQQLAKSAEDGGLLFVINISHGVMLDGVTYLCPADTTAESTRSAQRAKQDLVSDLDIASTLSQSDSAQKLLMIDLCQKSKDGREARPIEFADSKRDQLAIIRSCQSGERAFVSSDWPSGESHSLFAQALIRALGGDADLVYGNNDGRVTSYEAFHCISDLTKRYAEARGLKQLPAFQYSAFPFELVECSNLLPKPVLPTGNAALDKSAIAEVLAARGLAIEQDAEAHWRKKFRDEVRLANQISDQSFRDHHNQLCYALGNYLTPAVDLNPKCRKARLARGASHRSAGDYATALSEFRQCDEPEPLRLFATGKLAATQELYQIEAWGNPLFLNLTDEEIKQKLTRIELRAEPGVAAKTVGEVFSANHLTISEVQTVAGRTGQEQWLLVTDVDSVPLKTPGWIHQSQVHWFPEAAELYVPGSPLYQGGVPAIIKAQQLASAETAKSQRLLNAIQKLEKVKRGLEIAAIAGAPVGQAIDIIGTVQGGLQIGYLASRQKYVNTYTDYQIAVQHSQWLTEERQRLMRKRDLDTLREVTVTIKVSPWTEVRTASKNP